MTSVLESLNAALHRCLAQDGRVHFLGEDVLDPYGGAFKLARGLSSAFPEQVLTTPVSEAGIVGLGIGMALRGLRPVVEIMFGDFLTLAADQLINHAAKFRWMSKDQLRVPLVVRTPMGGRRGYGPTHSQSLEKHFLGVPGLRVLAPAALDDPGALLEHAVLKDDDPLLFIEHKLLYPLQILPAEGRDEWRMTVQSSPNGYPTYRLQIQDAPAPALTLVTYGYMASLALEAALELAYRHEIFSEVLVYTQLSPLLPDPLLESLAGGRNLLVLEEGAREHGWGAGVVALAAEKAAQPFAVARLAALDLPIPAAGSLEAQVLPDQKAIVQAALRLVGIPVAD